MNHRRPLLQFVSAIAVGLISLLSMQAAYALDTVVLDDTLQQWSSVASTQELLRDPADTLHLDDILAGQATFVPATQDVINLGSTEDSIWVHLRVSNTSAQHSDPRWILELAYARLARVDIFLLEAGVLQQQDRIGYERRMSERALKHHFFAQPLHMEPGHQYDLYVNVMRKGGGIQIPLRLYRPNRFAEYTANSNHIYGLYFGIMFAMLVYNAFLLVSVGNRAYLYYVLNIICTFLTFQVLYGYGFEYLWPETPIINEYAIQITVSLTSMTGLLFLRQYIDVARYHRWMNQAINVMLVLGTTLIVTRIVTHNPLILHAALFVGVTTILMLTISSICWRRGSRPAGFFLLAWSVFLFGACLHLLTITGILPSNDVTTIGVILGSAIEVLTLSLGLADHINQERRERYLALQGEHSAIMELKIAEEKLMDRALHSNTTGLPNRAFLRTILDQRCAQGTSHTIALLLFSLDNFHEFNKTLGHNNGDALLNIIATHIARAIEAHPAAIHLEINELHTHKLACIEGVTFAIVLQNQSAQEIELFCRNLLDTIEQPMEFQGLTLEVNASIGVAFFPDQSQNAENLLRNAHVALELAANSGRQIALYSRDMDPYSARRISMLAALREAISQDSLELYVQPQISLHDQSVTGAEVLLRWQHPEYGFVAPDEFIPLAERTGVIHPLTFWVCRNTFALSREFQNAGIPLNLSINISARNLQASGFSKQIEKFAHNAGIALHSITMELTETAVMGDRENALRVMTELARMGIRLSIDDFGTGYSSLAYLKQLPVDEIKIDRSFIKDMLINKDDHTIVHTTISMGHNLGLKVVAEGIEDAATLQSLQTLDCDLAQGYHIAKPMPVAAFREWLEKNKPPRAC